MLVSMKNMLADAREHHYAIPAFDVSNDEMMRAVLDTCEEERSPALLQVLCCDLEGRGMQLLTSMLSAASAFYTVPICVQLDHATELSLIKQAIQAGVSSVMYDGSVLPFEENAAKTAEVVRLAHKAGCTVEAELGHVGNAMVGNEADHRANENPEDTLTDPGEVVEFVKRTQVDALAVAIGTAHGVYRKTPTLHIERLDAITALCDCPLVIHGGSGTPTDQMREAIAHGITKVNIYSDVVAAMNRGLQARLSGLSNPATWPVYLFEDARSNMRQVVREKIRTFGSNERV